MLYLPRVRGAQIGVAILNLPTTTNGTVPLECRRSTRPSPSSPTRPGAPSPSGANTCATRELSPFLSPTGQGAFRRQDDVVAVGPLRVGAHRRWAALLQRPQPVGHRSAARPEVGVGGDPELRDHALRADWSGNLATDVPNRGRRSLDGPGGDRPGGVRPPAHQRLRAQLLGHALRGHAGPMPNAWSARNADQQRRNSLKTQ